MKIVSLHKYYSDRDGASRYQLEVNRLLEAFGHEVIPFAMDLPENLPTKWSKYFVSPVRTRTVGIIGGLKTLRRMMFGSEAKRAITKLVQDEKPELAHVHNIYTQISPSVFGPLRKAHIPTVMTVHDYHLIAPNYMLWYDGEVADLRHRGLFNATFTRFHKNSYAASFAQALTFKYHYSRESYKNGVDIFLCPSDFVRQRMASAGFPESKLRTLPHFVDTTEITPKYGGDGSVLFAGRFVEEKGVKFVLDLAGRMKDTRFVLAGDGELRAEVEARANGLSNVTCHGWADRKTMAELYRNASLVVVPSLWHEVFGLVALEAMAYGKPVVVSDSGGLPEVVEDGVSGVVLPAGDEDAWVESLSELLSEPAELERMGAEARQRAETEFTPEKHLAGLIGAFEEAKKRCK